MIDLSNVKSIVLDIKKLMKVNDNYEKLNLIVQGKKTKWMKVNDKYEKGKIDWLRKEEKVNESQRTIDQ
jgi:hypothetical protein